MFKKQNKTKQKYLRQIAKGTYCLFQQKPKTGS